MKALQHTLKKPSLKSLKVDSTKPRKFEDPSVKRTEDARNEADWYNAKTDELRDIIKLRAEYALKIFTFLIVWCFTLLGLIILQGCPDYLEFELDNKVFAVLVGSATVSAIGLVGFMVKGLFSIPKE